MAPSAVLFAARRHSSLLLIAAVAFLICAVDWIANSRFITRQPHNTEKPVQDTTDALLHDCFRGLPGRVEDAQTEPPPAAGNLVCPACACAESTGASTPIGAPESGTQPDSAHIQNICPSSPEVPTDTPPSNPRLRQPVLTYPCISQWKQSGTTKQLRLAFESLVLALEQGVQWTPTNLAKSHTDPCDIPFESVLNLDRMRAAFPGVIVNNPDPLLHRTFAPCNDAECFAASAKNQAHWATVITNLELVDELKQIVKQVQPNTPYVCLHARIEEDFQAMFGNHHRYKNASDIVEMIMKPNQFDSSIDTVYIAGGSPTEITKLINAHPSNQFTTIVSHKSSPASDSLGLLEMSLVDLAVCQDAAVHVGTAGSIWSEWVYDYRRTKGRKDFPSLMYGGDQQVNELQPFVGANDQRFFSEVGENAYTGPVVIEDAWVESEVGIIERDTRITLAVERARQDDTLTIPGDFAQFFGYEPVPGQKKLLHVLVRMRDSSGALGAAEALVVKDGSSLDWKGSHQVP